MESQARGGTRWRRFGLVMVPSVAATAAIGVALAQGALAASFTVSGQEFKVRVDELIGRGFVQYGTTVKPAGEGERLVAVTAFDHAEITDLCQSVRVDLPMLGTFVVKLTAGGGDRKVVAENLFIDLEQLDAGEAVFENIDIGVSVNDTDHGPNPEAGVEDGSFAQQAQVATLTDVEQTAWATHAGSFTLPDLSLGIHRGTGAECFR